SPNSPHRNVDQLEEHLYPALLTWPDRTARGAHRRRTCTTPGHRGRQPPANRALHGQRRRIPIAGRAAHRHGAQCRTIMSGEGLQALMRSTRTYVETDTAARSVVIDNTINAVKLSIHDP